MPTTPQRTKPGTRKLSDLARHLSVPTGITSTGWPAVEATCRTKMGVEFDDWQHAAGRVILAKRADGTLAATVDGVGMSLPRQVGKTYLIGALVFALCINTPGLLVIWSAHHARTHAETFLAMQGFAERSKVRPFVGKVYTGSGDEEVRFLNGSRILFGARERGFGRGIPGVDVLIFDEAQILSDKALSNMLATMNTSTFGLQLYIGTPPKPEDMSESFTRMRTAAIAKQLTDGAWIEFGVDPGADPNDRKQWARANPSFPHRTPAQSILRLQRKLTPGDFRREGLGIWDEATSRATPTVGAPQWDALVSDSVPDGPAAFGVRFSEDGRSVAVAAAVAHDDDVTVEVIGVSPTETGMAELCAWLVERLPDSAGVAVDGASGSASFAADLIASDRRVRRKVHLVTTPQAIEAHTKLLEMVQSRRLHHTGQQALSEAVGNATKRKIGTRGGWGWQHIDPNTDIQPLEAATLAVWLASTSRKRTKTGKAVFA